MVTVIVNDIKHIALTKEGHVIDGPNQFSILLLPIAATLGQ